MGNIAWRVDRKLHFDAASERFVNDDQANSFLGRTYRSPGHCQRCENAWQRRRAGGGTSEAGVAPARHLPNPYPV